MFRPLRPLPHDWKLRRERKAPRRRRRDLREARDRWRQRASAGPSRSPRRQHIPPGWLFARWGRDRRKILLALEHRQLVARIGDLLAVQRHRHPIALALGLLLERRGVGNSLLQQFGRAGRLPGWSDGLTSSFPWRLRQC